MILDPLPLWVGVLSVENTTSPVQASPLPSRRFSKFSDLSVRGPPSHQSPAEPLLPLHRQFPSGVPVRGPPAKLRCPWASKVRRGTQTRGDRSVCVCVSLIKLRLSALLTRRLPVCVERGSWDADTVNGPVASI
jgi:hypothetical protein